MIHAISHLPSDAAAPRAAEAVRALGPRYAGVTTVESGLLDVLTLHEKPSPDTDEGGGGPKEGGGGSGRGREEEMMAHEQLLLGGEVRWGGVRWSGAYTVALTGRGGGGGTHLLLAFECLDR